MNTVLLCGLQRKDIEPFNVYAQIADANVVGFSARPETFNPDYGILRLRGRKECLVVLYGTTNGMQWAAHVGSALFPALDVDLRTLVVGSFYAGEQQVEPILYSILSDTSGVPLKITGHSYGASAAFILACHMKVALRAPKPSTIELMTFGEPRSYNAASFVPPIETHLRIIASSSDDIAFLDPSGVDPIVFSPPNGMQFFKFFSLVNLLATFAVLRWKHFGDVYYLTISKVIKEGPVDPRLRLTPLLNDSLFVKNLAWVDEHLPDTSYMLKARNVWIASGLNPELAPLRAICDRYLGFYVPPPIDLVPPVPDATINDAWEFSPGTFNASNRLQWDTVSASSGPTRYAERSNLENPMTLMKGTIGYNTVQGGFSESVYSADPADDQIRMIGKMKNLLKARTSLSQTDAVAGCNNPIIPQFIRVSDTLSQRASIVQKIADVAQYNFFTAGTSAGIPPNVYLQNLDLENGPRIQYNSGVPRQGASQVLHGMPIAAFREIDPVLINSTTFLREARPTAQWLNVLRGYIQSLYIGRLGFRVIAGVWNDAITGLPGPYSNPNSWYYNTTEQMIELQWTAVRPFPDWPAAPPQLLGQKPSGWPTNATLATDLNAICRVQIRRWKAFKPLMGRWSAQVVKAQPGNAFALRIIRQCRLPQCATDVVPQASPIAWKVWVPGEAIAPTGNSTLAPFQLDIAGSVPFVESKKLGRNFEQERGRARNRPT